MGAVIRLLGYTQEQADEVMPTVVEKLGLGHELYSVELGLPVQLFSGDGKPAGFGKMIVVPGFQALREPPERLNDLSLAFSSVVPVTMADAPVVLAIGQSRF